MASHTIRRKITTYHFGKQRSYFIFDVLLTVFTFSLFGVFRPDYVIVASFFVIIAYLFFTRRNILFKHLVLAFVLGLTWVSFARDIYGYNQDFWVIFGINLYPLFSWTAGLFAVYVLYTQHRYFDERWGFVRHLALFFVFYLIMLIFVETVAYHYFGIRITTGQYAGLPVCDCLHAPIWMKVVYFLMGPVFFSLAYILGLEKYHIKVFFLRNNK